MTTRRRIGLTLAIVALLALGTGIAASQILGDRTPDTLPEDISDLADQVSTEAACQSQTYAGAMAYEIATLEDWFTYGDHVVRATVSDERVAEPLIPIQQQDGTPVTVHARDVEIQVTESIDGDLRPGDEIWLRTHDVVRVDSASGEILNECFPLTPGIDILTSIVGDGTGVVSETGTTSVTTLAYIEDGAVVRTTRSRVEPHLDLLEGYSLPVALQQLELARDRAPDEPEMDRGPEPGDPVPGPTASPE